MRLEEGKGTTGYYLRDFYPSEFISWIEMFRRCYDPSRKAFKFYGAKGIKVCKRWFDFKCFIEDMGRKPRDQRYTLDRLDNSKDYSPSNCKWSTNKEQWENKKEYRIYPKDYKCPCGRKERTYQKGLCKSCYGYGRYTYR